MNELQKSIEPSAYDIETLRRRMEEAEEALRAIGSGEVDALVISTPEGEKVYTLQGSEHPYRIMVETMNEGAATLLEDGTVLYCNKRLAEMLGAPLEQIQGSCFFDFFHGDEKDGFTRLLGKAVKGEARAEMTLKVNGNPTLPVLLSMKSTPIQGSHPAACLVVADLTEQRRSREELEALVSERTTELAQRNRDLEDFASVISHDLQEPLRKVRRFGDLLTGNNLDNLSEEELDYIRRMQEAAVRMSSMIDGLLALSRISTRARPHSAVDLNQAVQEALSLLQTSLEKNKGTVEVDPLPAVEGERLQMQQLFQNLIGNALKFHRPGIPPHVRVSSRQAPGDSRCSTRVQILIEDNGIGFKPEEAALLFQPFRRLVNRNEFEGTGIGLAICRKIVERHGGQISAESAPGRGSTFIVSLPVKQVDRK